MPRLPQLTVIAIGPTVGLPSLVEPAEALLLTVPQLAEVVGLVMWTCLLARGARVPKAHERTPAAIEQPVSELAASIAQLRPAVVGRVSPSVTPVALPAPELVIVIT